MGEEYGRGRPPRLAQVFQSYDSSFYFVTACTWKRSSLLNRDDVHDAFRSFGEKALSEHHVAVGRYVLMPDHLHLFVRLPIDGKLQTWMSSLKNSLSKVLRGSGEAAPHWQRGFFDHLMRSGESYSEKWEYVRMNPVRAGLAQTPDAWPYQGEITPIRF